MPRALYALMVGAFGIGVTEFVIMGLLLEVSTDLGVSLSAAGLLISGYALGVVAGAPTATRAAHAPPCASPLSGSVRRAEAAAHRGASSSLLITSQSLTSPRDDLAIILRSSRDRLVNHLVIFS